MKIQILYPNETRYPLFKKQKKVKQKMIYKNLSKNNHKIKNQIQVKNNYLNKNNNKK